MALDSAAGESLFEVSTPLGFRVRVSLACWKVLVSIKHPVMAGHEAIVKETLAHPEEVRVSRSDDAVYLFYRKQDQRRWVCVVAKRLNGDGFLITAYPTDAIKEGVQVWPA